MLQELDSHMELLSNLLESEVIDCFNLYNFLMESTTYNMQCPSQLDQEGYTD